MSTTINRPCAQTVDTDVKPRVHTMLQRDDAVISFQGRLIGFATSCREEHTHPTTEAGVTRYVSVGDRCSACRWFEVRIFVVDHEYTEDCTCDANEDSDLDGEDTDDDELHDAECGIIDARARYLVVTYGITTVPGESHKRRAVWTNSAFEIIEILTQRNGGTSFLPATSARVIAQAASSDEAIRDAYINRAVA